MAKSEQPIVIKKSATRRLYNTRTRAHITLDDVAAMAKSGTDFVVHDAKTGEDITRLILTKVIFEHEMKISQSLLPVAILHQLIRFYGDGMQMLVRLYLEIPIEPLIRDQERFRRQSKTLGVATLGLVEEQVRQNMKTFERALAMFEAFGCFAKNVEQPDDAHQ
jgi:polyhydroxyalkanoate synthesis repressor PhaR